jgi:hypothetical protein
MHRLCLRPTSGTDIAMESAGVTLVKGDLRGIVRDRLSSATMRNLKQNLSSGFKIKRFRCFEDRNTVSYLEEAGEIDKEEFDRKKKDLEL